MKKFTRCTQQNSYKGREKINKLKGEQNLFKQNNREEKY